MNREKLQQKRARDGWFTYALLDLKQRYGIEGSIPADIDKAMYEYQFQLTEKFRQRWSSYRCNIPGCGTTIVIDGNQKAQRPLCSAVSAGIKIFEHS